MKMKGMVKLKNQLHGQKQNDKGEDPLAVFPLVKYAHKTANQPRKRILA